MREHSRQELMGKLHPHVQDGDDLQVLLDELEAKGWVSDDRAAQSVVNRRASKLGATRLKAELQAKGLSATLVSDTLRGLQESEGARATDIWRAKFGEAPEDAKAHVRQMRFLLARGFSADVVRAVLKHAAQAASLPYRLPDED